MTSFFHLDAFEQKKLKMSHSRNKVVKSANHFPRGKQIKLKFTLNWMQEAVVTSFSRAIIPHCRVSLLQVKNLHPENVLKELKVDYSMQKMSPVTEAIIY